MSVMWVMILGALTPLGLLMIIDARAISIDPPQPQRLRPIAHLGAPAFGPQTLAVGLGALSAVGVILLSGWIGPAVVIGCLTFWIGRPLLRGRAERGSETERVEALAGWVENLRDVLSAGDQPIGAIASTVSTCPAPIKPQVKRLAAGLGRQEPDLVLRRFADDINDPIGDLVAVGLLIAIHQGARTVGVLSALAEQARAHADRRRIVESERAPAQREAQILTGIMGLLVLALLVFGRSEYLRAYDTRHGQVFLSAGLVGFGALIQRVQRLARFARPTRFLTEVGVESRSLPSSSTSSSTSSSEFKKKGR
jgi:tight adherence protein B